MVPLADPPAVSIPGTPVLLLSGVADPIVPEENARRLAAQLSATGAAVEHQVLPASTAACRRADANLARQFRAELKVEAA